MKIFSIVVICLTLGIFYGLALHEQNNRNLEKVKFQISDNIIPQHNIASDAALFSPIEDEFANHVTGKEHRYLNTGISYIENPKVIKETSCFAENSNKQKRNSSGS